MALTQVSAATGPALDLAVVKTQCRISADVTDEDDYVSGVLIPAVADRGEASTGRAFLGPQTWDYALEGFPRDWYLEIPKPPLVSVTSVTYVDMGGVTQTWPLLNTLGQPNYLVQAPAGPRCARGRIALPFAGIWPIARPQLGAVTVRFVAGYGGPSALPPLLRLAMLMDAGTLFETRESVLTGNRQQAIQLPSGTQDIYRTYRSACTQRLDGTA